MICKHAFGVHKLLARFVHIREAHLKNIFNQNNNISESLNGEFKGRLKCTRGLKSEDLALIHLMIIYHNFFREHESLKNNMAPAQAIGIECPASI